MFYQSHTGKTPKDNLLKGFPFRCFIGNGYVFDNEYGGCV